LLVHNQAPCTPRLPTPPCSLARDLYARRARTCCRTQHPLQPAALAFVPYVFVLVRVRVLVSGAQKYFDFAADVSDELFFDGKFTVNIDTIRKCGSTQLNIHFEGGSDHEENTI
jgi:hypothetical protein